MSYTIRSILTLPFLLFFLITCLKELFSYFMLKRLAYQQYYGIVKVYSYLMATRKVYYNSRFIEDPHTREIYYQTCEELYNICLEILETPENYNYIYLLPQEMQNEIEEILNSPRYKLH